MSQSFAVRRAVFADATLELIPSNITLQYETFYRTKINGSFTFRIGGGMHLPTNNELASTFFPLITLGGSYLTGHSNHKFEAGTQLNYYFRKSKEGADLFSAGILSGYRYQPFPLGITFRIYGSASVVTDGTFLYGGGVSVGYTVR